MDALRLLPKTGAIIQAAGDSFHERCDDGDALCQLQNTSKKVLTALQNVNAAATSKNISEAREQVENLATSLRSEESRRQYLSRRHKPALCSSLMLVNDHSTELGNLAESLKALEIDAQAFYADTIFMQCAGCDESGEECSARERVTKAEQTYSDLQASQHAEPAVGSGPVVPVKSGDSWWWDNAPMISAVLVCIMASLLITWRVVQMRDAAKEVAKK